MLIRRSKTKSRDANLDRFASRLRFSRATQSENYNCEIVSGHSRKLLNLRTPRQSQPGNLQSQLTRKQVSFRMTPRYLYTLHRKVERYGLERISGFPVEKFFRASLIYNLKNHCQIHAEATQAIETCQRTCAIYRIRAHSEVNTSTLQAVFTY